MHGTTLTLSVGAFGTAALGLLAGTPAVAVRCHSGPGGAGIGAHCESQRRAGRDSEAGSDVRLAMGPEALGYNNPPGRGVDAPGWYDWKTGSFKVDITIRMPTCGALGDCLGKGSQATAFWDLSVVAVPRPGQMLPCIGAAGCDATSCAP